MSSSSSENKTSVLFVCLGNICRSPMAEAVFRHLVTLNGLQDRFGSIASAGTAGYHVGDHPDPRTVSVCRKHGVTADSRAQQVVPDDFSTFDYILAMDASNLRNLHHLQPPNSKAQVKLFGEFGDGAILQDPCMSSSHFLIITEP
ncbi:protein-tyrosine phosphatase [Puccinia sorghi]|uniref:Protein-tyrosine phosphatase n=1 Tax=Puccinia sorghi TaxID=27349 RepID=A0A0L6UJ88_9BASI|nr:protein-tyrosine phosphatase [Puccinia sorghi]